MMGNKSVLFVVTLLFLFATPIITEYYTLTSIRTELLELDHDFHLQFMESSLNGRVEDLLSVTDQTELQMHFGQFRLGSREVPFQFNGSIEHIVDLLSGDESINVQIDPQFSDIIEDTGFDPVEFDLVIYLPEIFLDQITALQITAINGKQVSISALVIPVQLPEYDIIFLLEELRDSLVLFDGFLRMLTIYFDLEFDDGLYNLDEITEKEEQTYDDLSKLLLENNIFPVEYKINIGRHLQNEIEGASKTIENSVQRIFGIISPILLVLYFSLIFVELDGLSKNKDKLSLLEIRGAIFRQRMIYQIGSMKKMIGFAFIISVLLPTIAGLILEFPTSYLLMNPIILVAIDIFIFLSLFIIDYSFMKQLENPNIKISLPRKTLGKIFLILGAFFAIVSIILHLFNNYIPLEFSIIKFKDDELAFLNMYAMFFIGVAILIIKIPIASLAIKKEKEFIPIFLKFVKDFNHYLVTIPLLLLFITPTLIAIDANSTIRLMSDERRDEASIGDLEIWDYQSSGVDDILDFIDKNNETIDSYGIVLNSRFNIFLYDSNIPNDVDLNIAIIINPGYWVENTKFYDNQLESNKPENLYELDNINTTIVGSALGYNLLDDYQITLPIEDNDTVRLETYEGKVIDNFNYAIPGVPKETTMIFGNGTLDYHKLGDFEVTTYLNYKDSVSENERVTFTNLLRQNDFVFDLDRFFISSSDYDAQLQENVRITKITNLLFPIFVLMLSFILISMDNANLRRIVRLLNEKGWTRNEIRKNFLIFTSIFFFIDLLLLSFAGLAAVYANLYTNLGNSYFPMPSAPEIFFSHYFWIVLISTSIFHIVYAYKLETNLRRLN